MRATTETDTFRGTARFAIVRRLGAGGMGVVYEAEDRQRGSRVALKTLPGLDPQALYLFKREFRSLADVVHPNLVSLHELFSEGDQWFFTMELVEGRNFHDHVRAARPRPTADLGTSPAHGSFGLMSLTGDTDRTGTGSAPAEPTEALSPTTGAVARPPRGASTWRFAPGEPGAPRDVPMPSTERVRPDPEAVTIARGADDSASAETGPHEPVAFVLAENRPPAIDQEDGEAPRPLVADLDRLRDALGQLVEGVLALHAAGKLHRDIKPSNVLVQPDGRVVLLDFGLVAEVEAPTLDVADEQTVAGTVSFMAPEQAAGRPLTPACDWYSVGVMLYLALTGRLPHGGAPREILKRKQATDPAPPSRLVAGVPADLDALCLALLARDPDARPSGPEIRARLRGGPAPPADARVPEPGPAAERAPFVGRERHLAALGDAFEVARGGRPAAVYVHGRSGVGKTVLIGHFLDGLAARERVVVLHGRCYERESVPYKALDSLIDALSRYLRVQAPEVVASLLPRDVSALARLFPVLRRVAAVAGAPRAAAELPDRQELRRRGSAALRELLGRLAGRAPLILSIDDLQWGDLDSAALLADLMRPPGPPPLLLLGAYRSEYAETSPCLRALRATLGQAGEAVETRTLEVEPLTPGESRALALALLGGDGASARARAELIARESGGSPYFVRELACSGASAPDGRGGPAPALDEVLWRRVGGLPGPSRRLLEVLAVSGRPLRQVDAYRAAGLEAGDTPALAALCVGHLARSGGPNDDDEVETYHDRIRETIVARLPEPDRRDLHRRLAGALEGAGVADPETLALHHQGAGDPARAGHYYRLAADQAAEALAFDRAATLYRRAIELQGLGAAEALGLQTRLADALANAGRCAEAARAYLRAAEGAGGLERVELERRAAYQFCVGGHLDEGREVLKKVLDRLGMRLPASQWRALLKLLTNRAALRVRGLDYRERPASEVPAWELARVDATWSVATGLGTKNIIVAPAFGSYNLRLALAAGEPHRIARALAWEAGQVSNDGEPVRPRVELLLGRAREIAGRLDDPYLHGLVAMAGGIADFTGGRWRSGRDRLDRADALLRERCTGVTWEIGHANSFLLWCVSYLGDFPEMARRSRALLSEALDKGDLFTAVNLGNYMIPLCRLAGDEAGEALASIEGAMDSWSRGEYDLQRMLSMMGATYVDLYLGQPSRAYRRIREQWPTLRRSHFLRAQLIRVVVPELRARAALGVAAAGREAGDALRDAEAWAARLIRERLPYADGMGRLILGGAAAIRGDRDGAAARLEEAARVLDSADMAVFAAVARRRLGGLLGGERGRALADEADARLRALDVADPARLAFAYAPWGASGP
jgi:hypothetical protein